MQFPSIVNACVAPTVADIRTEASALYIDRMKQYNVCAQISTPYITVQQLHEYNICSELICLIPIIRSNENKLRFMLQLIRVTFLPFLNFTALGSIMFVGPSSCRSVCAFKYRTDRRL